MTWREFCMMIAEHPIVALALVSLLMVTFHAFCKACSGW
jgi:hypothetical protein